MELPNKKIPLIVEQIRNFQLEERSDVKTISYSQSSTFRHCPHRWYLHYVKKLAESPPSIATVFGTAMHETLQNYFTVLYDNSTLEADNIDLHAFLEERLRIVYSEELSRYGKSFCTQKQLEEHYQDGCEILTAFLSLRHKYFSKRNMYLVGIEIPLYQEIIKGVYFRGYVDLVLYDSENDKFLIFDIKTSKGGWAAKDKSDQIKIGQLHLYNIFFSKQFNIPIEKVEAEYFIVRRKVMTLGATGMQVSRIQTFKPPQGKAKRNETLRAITDFISEAFTEEGTHVDKAYEARPSKTTCRFCEFNKTEHCIGC